MLFLSFSLLVDVFISVVRCRLGVKGAPRVLLLAPVLLLEFFLSFPFLSFPREEFTMLIPRLHRWDHESNKQGDEGFMGKVQAFRKKAGAKLVEKAVPSDPSKV